MSWSVNNFFKKISGCQTTTFYTRYKEMQDYKCRFTFAFTKMAKKNAELYKYNLVPRSIRPKLGNNPVYEVGWNIQDDGYSC